MFGIFFDLSKLSGRGCNESIDADNAR